MKRLSCLFLLLLPLAGCAFCEDLADFSANEWRKYTVDPNAPCPPPGSARACGDGPILQTGAQLPAQTAEPPR